MDEEFESPEGHEGQDDEVAALRFVILISQTLT